MNTALQGHWNRLRHRFDPYRMAALGMLLLALLVGAWLLALEQQADATQAAIARLRSTHKDISTPTVQRIPLAEQVDDFVAALPPLDTSTDDLEHLFDSAKKHNLDLPRGEYKLQQEVNAPLTSYTAILPVHGDYGAIRDFCADVLRDLPNASMEELRMARSSAEGTVLDAVIRFTFVYRR